MQSGKYIKVQDREGFFELSPSIHDMYAARPLMLEKLCFAQFVINYETLDRMQAKKIQFSNSISFLSGKTFAIFPKETMYLPFQIKLLQEKLGFMQLRNTPLVLRLHKYKESEEPHEYYYSELLLYKHWRKEEELFYDNFEKCSFLFHQKPSDHNSHKTLIQLIKDEIFPFFHSIIPLQSIIETASNNTGDAMDPENEHTNAEDILRGPTEENKYACRHHDLLPLSQSCDGVSSSKYKRVDLSNLDLMNKAAQKLVPEQRCAFDIIIEYCKRYQQAIRSNGPKPDQPLLLIHGGAGSGKSKLINDIANWAEYFLQTLENSNFDQPTILKLAPTGKAASIIQGLTLHSAFHFSFGNNFQTLSDKVKEQLRKDFSHLQIVIIDEVSMVKSDMLYLLNARLQEIKQNFDYFGGVGVVLVGDLMQLQPIQANWIFEAPKNPKFRMSHSIQPLWELFTAVDLKENHRQDQDKEYADILNRVRFGIQTESDIEVLSFRILKEYPSDSLFVFPTRQPVKEINLKKLEELPSSTEDIEAIHVHPFHTKFKPHISKDGCVNDTPFLSLLSVKKKARIMLTYNVNTGDGLTNGTAGIIIDFVKKGGNVTTILIKFDDPNVGQSTRLKYPQFLSSYSNCTPIFRTTFEYSLGRLSKEHTAKAKVIQFPIQLAWGWTAHKMQGQTVPQPQTLVADLKGIFTTGQTYVILGRVQSLNQLYLKSFNESCIKVNNKALKESQSISARAINKNSKWNNASNNTQLKLVCLNIRSLQKHYLDLTADSVNMEADVICLTETHIPQNVNTTIFDILGFQSFFANKGKGAGVAVYIKESYSISYSSLLMEKYFQIVKVSFLNFDLLTVYNSPRGDSDKILQVISNIVENNRETIICGDFNLHGKQQHFFISQLQKRGFQQYVDKPTHIQGNMLDLFFAKFSNLKVLSMFLHYPYYSDHDAICTHLQY